MNTAKQHIEWAVIRQRREISQDIVNIAEEIVQDAKGGKYLPSSTWTITSPTSASTPAMLRCKHANIRMCSIAPRS